jgi:hypothetical protein
MAKKKTTKKGSTEKTTKSSIKTVDYSEPVVEKVEEVKKEKPIAEKPAKASDIYKEYAFPTKSRCPRCNSIDTKAIGKHKGTQRRKCLMPVCRNRYTVIGERV